MPSPSFHEQLEGKMDFIGQQLVEQIARFVLITAVVVSFVAGFALQSLQVTFGIFGAATIFLALLVIPPWPMFNRHPVKWLTVDNAENSKDK